jgi:hypothetical protein
MKALATISLVSLLVACSAQADEFDAFFDPADNAGKFYAGVDLATATYGGSIYPSNSGLRIAGGYNVTSIFAIEAGYAMLSNSNSSSNNNNCGYGCGYGGGYGGYGGYPGYGYPMPLASYAFDTSSLQIAAVVNYPIIDGFSISGQLGFDHNSMNYASTDNNGNSLPTISGSHSNLMYGIGVQVNMGDGIDFRAQYENLGYLAPGIGMRMLSIGGIYNF